MDSRLFQWAIAPAPEPGIEEGRRQSERRRLIEARRAGHRLRLEQRAWRQWGQSYRALGRLP